MNTAERSLSQSLWDYLCALKLTMFLLISLAVTSIIGTIIPQGAPPQEYLQTITENKFKLYKTLGFFDMYHSWWFILLLALLTANLVACSIRRLPHIWKLITRPVTVMDDRLEKSLASVTTLTAAGDAATLKDAVVPLLAAEFATPRITEEAGAFHLFAEKAPWCRLAVYIVHLSVVVIFIGAIVGSLFGFKGFVNILEGDAVNAVISRTEKEIPLGFAVRCEQFSVSYYDTGAPKEFKSILTVLENGQPVPGYNRVPVIVNDPLSYKGITFYQSSYGKTGEHRFMLSGLDGSNPVPLTVGSEGSAKLPDGSGIHVLESTPDVAPFQAGLSGPAARVEVHTPKGETHAFVVFAKHPELNAEAAKKYGVPLFSYLGGTEQVYTGLQVAKDPGVWIVWLGCLLMVVGVYVAFFVSHRRIWIRVRDGEVTVGGNSSKNQSGFQLAFDRLAEKLAAHLVSGGKQ